MARGDRGCGFWGRRWFEAGCGGVDACGFILEGIRCLRRAKDHRPLRSLFWRAETDWAGGFRPAPVAQTNHHERLLLTKAAVELPETYCQQGAQFCFSRALSAFQKAAASRLIYIALQLGKVGPPDAALRQRRPMVKESLE